MPELRVPEIGELPARRLRAMLMAGVEALECRRVLERGGINLVSEVLRGQGEFVEYEHYPKDDVYDPDSRAQYYYHAHRGIRGEHGHFHTFNREPGRQGQRHSSSDEAAEAESPADGSAVTHLIAISMDAYGWPTGLFATNHWVTGGKWRSADDTIGILPQFRVDHAYPSWPVNRWLGAVFILFRAHVEALLRHRDQVIAAWAAAHPERDVLEDRSLDITGFVSIDVERSVQTVRECLNMFD
ncbi:MAG: hypothetical protein A3G24_07465 [Betaproteobacteria bacterium RIFCSPLOWO2_12_FULL_62_13]|nr:MAG: hypothetical protein A3G24_07465 [Betaproteobacteria bacterium RIFCSPLOWO2_12_FULL_62_13]